MAKKTKKTRKTKAKRGAAQAASGQTPKGATAKKAAGRSKSAAKAGKAAKTRKAAKARKTAASKKPAAKRKATAGKASAAKSRKASGRKASTRKAVAGRKQVPSRVANAATGGPPSASASPPQRKALKRATSRKPARTVRDGRSPEALKSARGIGPVRAARPAQPRPSVPASVSGVVVKGAMKPRYAEILSPEALAFVASLHRKLDGRRKALLAARAERQKRFDAGALPDFLPDTRHIRDRDWTVAPIPPDLIDRRVEITGPVDRRMIVNALNSGANVFMADFEDANSPTWANTIEGQISLRDRWRGRIGFTDQTTHKAYRLGADPAVLIVRPRGWHLLEEHVEVDGEPVSGALFDFGLYFFHNVAALIAHGTGAYVYLPKLEAHAEARLWNDVFVLAQEAFRLPLGVIKATVLIETLPAAFEMDEILFELKDHVVGLNCGRWDYIFSFIKTFANNPAYVLPDRGQVVMGKAFLGAYAALLIKTCHRRRAFAMGGMAAQIPVKDNPAANEAAFAQVRADKEREARDGHDGTWVAHPDLVPVARQVFDRLMPQRNQLTNRRNDVAVGQPDLLRVHEGTRTEEGFRHNIRVGVQYIEAWLRGRGAVPIYDLMEDAATAEISRAQIWQWIKFGALLDNGKTATPALFEDALSEEMRRVEQEIGPELYRKGRFPEAIALFRELSLAPEFADFLTIPAYRLIV